ncbi:MAG: zinc transporter ZntB [Rhodospirillales bacterium]|nr:zinc transporter ZntB [Rhodospirillales bacterium]
MILKAFKINGDGTGSVLVGDDISQAIRDEHLAWVHLDANFEEAGQWLRREISYLDPVIVEALIAEETRPRVLELEEGVLLILRGINMNENAQPEDMVSIRLWVDPHRIISLQRRNLRTVQNMEGQLLAGKGPKNAADFVVALSNGLIEHMEPVFSQLDDTLDDIEEKIIEEPDAVERHHINTVRRQAIQFRRYLAPQRDAIVALKSVQAEWFDLGHRRRLQEAQDRLIRYVEDLDTIRERAQIVKEELSSLLADKMNRNMYILSVIAAIFLPLGFLTGLLGINVGGIPGAEYSGAFYVFCAILTVLVAGQVAFFKSQKWF